jgi:hypothetical protein
VVKRSILDAGPSHPNPTRSGRLGGSIIEPIELVEATLTTESGLSMSVTTEATMLHQSGAAYRRRVGLVDARGKLTFAGIKPGGFSLYLGEEPHFHFDLEGRWQRMFRAGVHYLKALDGTVDALERVREGGSLVIHRRAASLAEAGDLDEAARTTAVELLTAIASGSASLSDPPAPAEPLGAADLTELLERVSRWDGEAWFRNHGAFLRVYGPGGGSFLPPSCPQPIILNATHTPGRAGSWAVGPAPSESESPRVLSPEEFVAHCAAVANFLGRRAAQARGVVLADGEALRRPAHEIVPWLEAAGRLFPIMASPGSARRLSERPVETPALDGIYSFLISPERPLPGAEGWGCLRAAHLRRVDIGVVSGDLEVRRVHRCPWVDGDLLQLVGDLQQAGIAIGLVIPVGAGGRELAAHHVDATRNLCNALGLSEGDLVYLVDLEELVGAETESAMQALGVSPLGPAERQSQAHALREALAPLRSRKIKVVPFSLEKQ